MSFIKWKPDLSVNVDVLDEQHQGLIGMVNDLADAMQEQKEKDALGSILEGLANYADQHFKTEEKYFVEFGYPETEDHKQEHRMFARKVLDFQDKFENEILFPSTDLLNFLCDWFKNHIKETDSRYSQFFNEHGLR